MAVVVYALCGTGRGHTSRALAVAATLHERGHTVRFAAGPPAEAELPGPVYRVPSLRQSVRGNRVRLLATARDNWPAARYSLDTIEAATRWLSMVGADVVVADHEPFVGRAARQIGIPVVSLSHQLLLSETRPPMRLGESLEAWGTAAGIAFLAPPSDAVVIPTFAFPPLRTGSRAVLVPPVLRDDVLAAQATQGDHVLVYLNEGDGMDGLLGVLGRVDAAFDVYGLPPRRLVPPNVRVHAPDRAAFLAHLAASRAVVATAGFTLLSEALHLGKPILTLPNRGFFEQTLNARAVVDGGRGEAVMDRDLRADDVTGFLSRCAAYARDAETPGVGRAGREACADVVEETMRRRRASPEDASETTRSAPWASLPTRPSGHMSRLSWSVLRGSASL